MDTKKGMADPATAEDGPVRYPRRWPDGQLGGLIAFAAKQAAELVLDDAEMAADEAVENCYETDTRNHGVPALAWFDEIEVLVRQMTKYFAAELLDQLRADTVKAGPRLRRAVAELKADVFTQPGPKSVKWAQDLAAEARLEFQESRREAAA